MQTKSTREVAHVLKTNPARIEQWISQGHFKPKAIVAKGVARAWTFDEALRLALFMEIVDLVRNGAEVAAQVVPKVIDPDGLGTKFFVLHHHGREGFANTWLAEFVEPFKLGRYLDRECAVPKFVDNEFISEAGRARIAVVVDLPWLAQELREAWEA